MAIAFQCSGCRKAYKVKDELAGKKVVCTACKKPIKVPLQTAAAKVSDSATEHLALAALSEAPATAAEEAAGSITVECPNCIEQVTFDASLAGKQSPCPNCKRIVRVPVPATGKKDWRSADNRPTFAKVQPAHDLKGVVSTASTTVVSRDALAEANALRKRPREPIPLRQKITWTVIGVSIVALLAVGLLIFRGKRVVQRRDDLVKEALTQVRSNTKIPAGVRAETFRAAGEYELLKPDAKAEAATSYLANAREILNDGNTTDQPFEKVALLSRVAETEARLAGTPEQIKEGTRRDWTQMLKELRFTMRALTADSSQREGQILAVRRLARELGLRGAGDQVAVIDLVTKAFDNPADRAESLAAAALEFLNAGDAGQKKATAVADQIATSISPSEAGTLPRVVALNVALGRNTPGVTVPVADSPAPPLRIGFAEGYARAGKLDLARHVAGLGGNFDDRFKASVAVAAAALDAKAGADDLTRAVELFTRELGGRDLPDWPLIWLAQLCAASPDPKPAQLLTESLSKLANLSERSQSVQAWALMELGPGTTHAVKAIAPESSLGYLLAWEYLARKTKPASVAEWPENVRPLGLVGSAIGALSP